MEPLISSIKENYDNFEIKKQQIINFDEWCAVEECIKQNYPIILPFVAKTVQIPLQKIQIDLKKEEINHNYKAIFN